MSTMPALAASELTLYVREWGMLVFAFVFPPLMMLILAGVFAGGDDEAFGNVDGTDWYIVSYLAVPMASIALTALPVMMAGYAEAGILKRYAASGVEALQVVVAQAATCVMSVLAGAGLVLAVAAPVYGIPEIQRPLNVLVIAGLGVVTMMTLGVALGLMVGSVRVANALGLTIFFPMFILGGGGPPPEVMTPAMQDVADVMPLTHVTLGLRQAWLQDAGFGHELSWILGWLVVGLVLVGSNLAWRRRRS